MTQVRSIQQQIEDLEPDVNATFCLLWEEIVQDGVPINRAARRMRVSYDVAQEEMGLAKVRLQGSGVGRSRYPIDMFNAYGLDGVPRREYVPELAAAVL